MFSSKLEVVRCKVMINWPDKECPSSGITSTGRVWRKVPEGDARCVQYHLCRSVDAKLTEGLKFDGLLKIQT